MFRFLHAADTHIDSPLDGLEVYDGAPVEALRGATRRAFENLVALALDEPVDFVLLAGDVYDGDWKDFSTGLFFTRQMARLDAAGIPVYLIAGNHDAASVLTRRLSLPPNVHLFSTRVAETKEVPGVPVVVHGRGFPNRAVPENLVPDYPPPVASRFNVGLLHTSLTGAAGHDTYAPCALRDLQQKGYDYWALGHVHLPQVLAERPWVVFAGNTQGRHVRETGPRGCRLVTVDDSLDVVSCEHRALDVVRWSQVTVDLCGIDHEPGVLSLIGDALQQASREADGRLLAARITLTGATPLHDRLRRDLPRLRAECIAQAQRVAGEGVWIEEVEVGTAPVVDPQALAQRDDLTRVVLASLDAAGSRSPEVPPEVEAMLKLLPGELRTLVEDELTDGHRGALLEDVRAIVLDALGTRSGGAP
jgi:DNA repair exonuclease SbcCD nuclease subunit